MSNSNFVDNKIYNNEDFVFGLSDIDLVVDFLKKKIGNCKIFAFYGPLGAGKTTIIRELLRSCGVQGPIASPTFTYMNFYKSSTGIKNDFKFYHFDLYRLNNVNEFFDAGFDEYLHDQGGISFVEWPEIIESILPSGTCKVKIDYNSDVNKRLFRAEILE